MTTAAQPPLLRDPSFRNLYLASAVSQFGTQVGYVAMPLLAVLALDAGPGEVGLLSALTTITVLVLGLPAGAWVDRVRRRPVMVAADLVRAALLASVTVTWWLDALTMTQLYGVAVATGAGTLFFDVASQSTVPHLVGRDRLTAANSVLVGTNAAMDVGGRSSAGVLVALAGAPVAILLDALTYLWSAVWLCRISKPEPAPAPVPGERLGRRIGEGVRFLFGNRVLTAIAAQGGMTNLAFPLCSALLPVLLVDELGHPAWVLGAYLAAGGLGVLAGSSTAHLIGRRFGHGRAVWIAGLATAPFALLVPFAGWSVWISAAAWSVVCFRTGVNNVLLVSFRQKVTPDPMLGRMNATMRLILMGAVGVGGLLAGLLGEVWGIGTAMWAGAAIMALSWTPIWLSPLRHEV
ncbi:enterobactin exporter EntS [Nonomuraea coxensis DSM 45129]|uniref:Enterobactin exporter EntS n=1 Tax=Nonomuraea coxensis DSM 45129 TaxID=1122611 RepID=A0ABX8U3L0_9ACTN|nr:MFS transporter [Nonomuraea coxensis]QYC42340.1 enterobactin exporter EntS [Nonomuraea coxensis DSM 45129]